MGLLDRLKHRKPDDEPEDPWEDLDQTPKTEDEGNPWKESDFELIEEEEENPWQPQTKQKTTQRIRKVKPIKQEAEWSEPTIHNGLPGPKLLKQAIATICIAVCGWIGYTSYQTMKTQPYIVLILAIPIYILIDYIIQTR